jgi:hypothetical protein
MQLENDFSLMFSCKAATSFATHFVLTPLASTLHYLIRKGHFKPFQDLCIEVCEALISRTLVLGA